MPSALNFPIVFKREPQRKKINNTDPEFKTMIENLTTLWPKSYIYQNLAVLGRTFLSSYFHKNSFDEENVFCDNFFYPVCRMQ